MKGLALVHNTQKTAIVFRKQFEKKGVELEIMEMQNFYNLLNANKIKQPFTEHWDFVLLLYHKNYDWFGLFDLLEQDGIRVFNTPTAVTNCDDKWLCYQVLHNANIPQMPTYETVEQAKESGLLEKDENGKLLKKVVVKDRFGSFGEKVHLVSYYKDFKQLISDLESKETPYILQEFCETTKNRGVRVTCVGGKYIASYYKKTTNGDFVVNLHNNAVGQEWKIPFEFIDISEKTAKVIGCDYCGIDLMFGENDTPIVCEVNARAVFSAMEKINDVDIKGLYVDYIIDTVNQNFDDLI